MRNVSRYPHRYVVSELLGTSSNLSSVKYIFSVSALSYAVTASVSSAFFNGGILARVFVLDFTEDQMDLGEINACNTHFRLFS